jgi:hypothetical protein
MMVYTVLAMELTNGDQEMRDRMTENYYYYRYNIVKRYEARLSYIDGKRWMKHRAEVLRQHKGMMRDKAFPYMLTRNELERGKIQGPSSMVDVLKSTIDSGRMEHTENSFELTDIRVNTQTSWDDADYVPNFRGEKNVRRVRDEEEIVDECKEWRLQNMRVREKPIPKKWPKEPFEYLVSRTPLHHIQKVKAAAKNAAPDVNSDDDSSNNDEESEEGGDTRIERDTLRGRDTRTERDTRHSRDTRKERDTRDRVRDTRGQGRDTRTSERDTLSMRDTRDDDEDDAVDTSYEGDPREVDKAARIGGTSSSSSTASSRKWGPPPKKTKEHTTEEEGSDRSISEEEISSRAKKAGSARNSTAGPAKRTDIKLVREAGESTKVVMEYETWLELADIFNTASKYVDELFKFRIDRSERNIKYRRQNKEQASRRGKADKPKGKQPEKGRV